LKDRLSVWFGSAFLVAVLFLMLGLAALVILLLDRLSGGRPIINHVYMLLVPIGLVLVGITCLFAWSIYGARIRRAEYLTARFVDIVALVYHEGRHVRHLLRNGQILDPKYVVLRNNLAQNQNEAWRQMQSVHHLASHAQSAGSAKRIFERQFGLTMDEMVTLYSDPAWSETHYGGNAWLQVTHGANELANYLDLGREDEARRLLFSILRSSPNNDTIIKKLHELDLHFRQNSIQHKSNSKHNA
jgi:hypothetical protein